jgi:hypothetical protein
MEVAYNDYSIYDFNTSVEVEANAFQVAANDSLAARSSGFSINPNTIDAFVYEGPSQIYSNLNIDLAEVFSNIGNGLSFENAFQRMTPSQIEMSIENTAVVPILSNFKVRIDGGLPSIVSQVSDYSSDYYTTYDQYTDYARIMVNDANVLLYGRMMITTTSASLTMSDMTNDASFIAVLDRGDSFPGLKMEEVPEYADNAAALLAGLDINVVYRTGDLLKIVH